MWLGGMWAVPDTERQAAAIIEAQHQALEAVASYRTGHSDERGEEIKAIVRAALALAAAP